MKMPGKYTGPQYLSIVFGERGKRHLGGHDLVRRVDRQGEVLILVQEMLGLCETMNPTKIDELLQAAASGRQGTWQAIKTNTDSRRRQGSRGNKLDN